MKYYIITFGCQMNKSDSERIASVLEEQGYKPIKADLSAEALAKADLIVVNMCSVRQSAVDRIYGLSPKFKKLKMENSKLKTILTGCVLKEDRRKFAKKFDLILSIKNLPKLPSLLSTNEAGSRCLSDDYLKIKSKRRNKFSAFVPIMRGCNNFCTYCVVPHTRGQEVSRPTKEILSEIKNLVEKGYKEIWLLGQNVNSYKDGEISFPKLLKKADEIKGDFWVRFTSSHPKDFSDELIKTIAECQKVTEYLNLPVQSGDNAVLEKMNRPYTIEKYKNLVKKIRKRIPEISLSTDAIAGFPGETKKQFQNTVSLFKEITFDMAYIARYSPRSQTAAAKLKDDVPPEEKERRWQVLTGVLKKTALEKNEKYIGKEVEVLIDSAKKNFYFGKTRTYKTVKIQSITPNLVGQFVKVKIIDASPWGLRGILI